MGWLDRSIKQTVDKAIAEVLPRHIDDAVDRAITNSPKIQFVKAMQMQMLGCDPKMGVREAWDVAVEALRNFLADEEIEFGDPRYDWSRDGAVTLIHEYEIHHWETAA